MSGLTSSAKFRRRLGWFSAFVLVAGVVAVLVVVIRNPPPPAGSKTEPGGTLVAPNVPMKFAPHQNAILGLAQLFVVRAVTRKNVAASWQLVCPEMRQGYTQASWSKGDIPVVPFPAYSAKWHLAYSFKNEVDLQVALYAKPQAKLNPVVFDLTLHPCGKAGSTRWLVSSFIPTPSASGNFGPSNPESARMNPLGLGTKGVNYVHKSGSGLWLLIPLGVTLGMLLTALGIVIVRGYRGKRLYNEYVRERSIARPPTGV